MHEIVEALTTLQDVVYQGARRKHTEADDPYSNHRNDAGATADEKTEDGEQGGDDINYQNSAG